MSEDRTRLFGCYDARFLRDLLPGVLMIVAAAVLAFVLPKSPETRLLKLGLVSVGTAWTVVMVVAALRRLDELQQRIHLIAIAISFAVTGVVVVMTKFLNLAGFTAVPTGMWLWVFMCMTWVVAAFVLNRRYQ